MIKCIAIDDEPIALSVIRQYCERRGGIMLETYSSPRLGMQRICEWKPDLVFLDIELNSVSGLELARQLPSTSCLIFTTAYAHYALDGYEVNAVDFLHKPFFYERFNRAMKKAEEWLRMHELLALSESSSRQLLLKSEYKNVTVPLDSILYLESNDNYVRVYLTDGSSILSKITLCSLEEQLPIDEFIRIHRSFIISRKRVLKFTRQEVFLAKVNKSLPVGKKYAESMLVALGKG
ncbi:MAG: LytR/AlgR family response regulator transcription factor [Parabacteroides sp.]